MALSKQQIEDLASWKTHLTLWERDLLYMAGKFEGWLDIAVDLGFTVEKILKLWTFKDAGRRVKIMTWAEYRDCMNPTTSVKEIYGERREDSNVRNATRDSVGSSSKDALISSVEKA